MNDEIKRLKAELQQAVDRYEEAIGTGRYVPECGDGYWRVVIYPWGRVTASRFNWSDNPCDRDHLERGNVFKTREEAQAVVKHFENVQYSLPKIGTPLEMISTDGRWYPWGSYNAHPLDTAALLMGAVRVRK